MKTFEQFLHDNSSQTSLNCLLDSLNNWKKSTLTFKDAVNTVELMAYYIDILTKENEKLRNQNIKLLKRLKNKLEKASIYADSFQENKTFRRFILNPIQPIARLLLATTPKAIDLYFYFIKKQYIYLY